MRIRERLERLEAARGKRDRNRPKREYDHSKVTPEDDEWAIALCASLPQDATGPDLTSLTDHELRRLEWISSKCTPDSGGYGHDASCECYYCQPYTERPCYVVPETATTAAENLTGGPRR